MRIARFAVEEWMNRYETRVRWNIAETCVDSLSARELLDLAGTTPDRLVAELADVRLTYGDIEGRPDLRRSLGAQYRTAPEVVTAHGAIGANFLVQFALVEPGDRVVCVHPTYQQLYDVPRALGATVELLRLRPENGYLPDLDELRRLLAAPTRLVILNNPNNPTGALIPEAMLGEIVELCRRSGTRVLCDEVYRDLVQPGVPSPPSIVDLYEHGIATGSMSKVFSLAGLRLGWVATRDAAVMEEVRSRRDYTTISCGMVDERLAALALEAAPAILARSLGVVRDNLAILDAWVAATPGVAYVRPQAGTTALLAFAGGASSEALCRRLVDAYDTLLVPGTCFDIEGTARIGFANGAQVLREGLARVAAALAAPVGV